MATTIQIKEVAKQRLDRLKDVYGASSYDEVIMRITDERKDSVRSMFGSAKGIGPWKKEYRMRFKHE